MKPKAPNHVLQLLISRPEDNISWSVQTVQFNNLETRYVGDPDGIRSSSKKSFLSFCILAIFTSIQQINSGGSTKKLAPLGGQMRESLKKVFQLSGSTKWVNLIFGMNPFGVYLERTGSLEAKTFSVVFREGIRVVISLEGDDRECTDVITLTDILKRFRLELEKEQAEFILRIIRAPKPSIDTISKVGSIETEEHFRIEILNSIHTNYCVFWIDGDSGNESKITELYPSLEVDIRVASDEDNPNSFQTFMESKLSGLRIPQESRLRVEKAYGCATILVFSKQTRFSRESIKNFVTLIEGTLPLRSTNLFLTRPHFAGYSSKTDKSSQNHKSMLSISGPRQPLDWDRALLSCLSKEEFNLKVFHIPISSRGIS